ncbi:conserved hypothetical protein [Parafrankia sp. EAN1pec]|uniref:nuclear transport factor 2 family protein n=1 Tax=Parafrankia sp. (strain EAN1pec) TaxID=298653 RepID=UPI00005428A0|nr:conserved hypothetical protein [Frankia sp. EAN1pec]
MTPHPPTDDLRELVARLGRLEDERAIYRLMCRYGEALDYGLDDQLVDLFTPTATWSLCRGGQVVKSVSGAAALRSWCAGHSRSPADVHKHVVTNVRIEVHGDRAAVTSYFARLDANRERRASFVYEMGRYRDRVVRCDDGSWRFDERIVEGEDNREHRVSG